MGKLKNAHNSKYSSWNEETQEENSSPHYGLKQTKTTQLSNMLSTFSIIIPTYNSEKYIAACLESIYALDYPKENYKVILVDGGSQDKTLNIISSRNNLKLLHSGNISISNSRNIGAQEAKSDHLVFIDSDCLVNKDLLKKANEHLKKHVCCGAFYKPSPDHSWVSKAWLLIENKHDRFVDWVSAGTLIINRQVFFEIGGFNEELETSEDLDLGHRLLANGHKILNDSSMASIHLGQSDNLRDFFIKEMWRGNSFIKNIKKNGIKRGLSPFSLIIFFYFLVIFSLPIILILGNTTLILIYFFLIFFCPLLLTIRIIIKIKNFYYFFHFYILFFIYLIARCYSILKYNQLKELI